MLTTMRIDPAGCCEAGDLLRKVGLETAPLGLMSRHKSLTHSSQMTLEGLVWTHLSGTESPVACAAALIFSSGLGDRFTMLH